MERLIADKTIFKTYKMCRYATDVTFQQSFRPGGSLEEAKKYYSGKHELYGYKLEVSVLPNGLAISASCHYPGSVPDIEIMRAMLCFHDDALDKTVSEKDITDIGIFSEKFPDSWGVLLDKGYCGIESEVRAAILKKEPPGDLLIVADRRENEAKAADRVLVENYFGRQGNLWAVVSSKYRWAEGSYDNIFRVTLALTNHHIKWHPLRDEDGRTYERYMKRLNDIGETTVSKRKRSQGSYRRRRQRMMQRTVRSEREAGAGAMLDDEDDGEESIGI